MVKQKIVTLLLFLICLSFGVQADESSCAHAVDIFLQQSAVHPASVTVRSARITLSESSQLLEASIPHLKYKNALGSLKQENEKYAANLVKLEYSNGSAFLVYRHLKNERVIMIDDMEVDFDLRHQAISKQLLARAIAQFPETREMMFYLDKTNKTVFDSFDSLNDLDKLKETPIYKVLSQFGFGQLKMLENVTTGEGHALKTYPFVILQKSE